MLITKPFGRLCVQKTKADPLKLDDGTSEEEAPYLTIIIPVYNEEQNIPLLYDKLVEFFSTNQHTWEAIFIDDGSTDKSFQELQKISDKDHRVTVIKFVRNFGQTAAMAAGIDFANGRVIIPMDSDLQNDPVDITNLLNKLDEGYDVVSGWRKDRHDALLNRKIPSWIANGIISWISGVKLHDYGCSLKAYRKEVVKGIRLYGEMHRFLPIYASWQGARVTEIPVIHHARKYGESKYGISRTIKVILDLITVKFMSTYLTKPIYVFGLSGLLCLFISFAAFVWMVVLKYCYETTFIETPLPVLVSMFFLVGVQLVLMGLLGEMIVRTYYESQDKRIYIIEKKIARLKQIDEG